MLGEDERKAWDGMGGEADVDREGGGGGVVVIHSDVGVGEEGVEGFFVGGFGWWGGSG